MKTLRFMRATGVLGMTTLGVCLCAQAAIAKYLPAGKNLLSTSLPSTAPPADADAMPQAEVTNLPTQLPLRRLAPLLTLPDATTPLMRNELPSLGTPEAYLPPVAPQIALMIDLSDRRVYVYEDGQRRQSYPIAIGREGWETPVGRFQVMQMIRNPAWQHPFNGSIVPPGPNNPLGTRWIGFWTDGRNYIGFHGTPNEESVGRAASHGCIRMLNRDVVELFERVRIGTPVTVVP